MEAEDARAAGYRYDIGRLALAANKYLQPARIADDGGALKRRRRIIRHHLKLTTNYTSSLALSDRLWRDTV